jgi:D-alanyl-D-alanine-carboxypeptidase/D-alanyl-D-alanine-endopeptidase
MGKNQFLITALCTVLIGHGIPAAFASTDLNIENSMDMNMDIQALLQEYVDDNNSIGAAVGLIDHGTIQFFSYGKMFAGEDAPISEDTIFEIGSITKVFTTLALMDMVTQGKVQLDDPIELYLPEIKIPEKDGKKITLRHLATHHSGIPRLPDNFDLEDRSNPYANYLIENLYEFLSHHVLQRIPGEHWEYSNVGMGLLGHILALKSGKSYEQLIFDSISSKLSMENTGVALTSQMQKQFAKGHQSKQEVSHWDFQPCMAGCGGLRSSIKDMTQFLAANMGLLNSPVSDLLRQCHSQQYELAPQMGIGLGWMLNQPDADTKIIWHNGGTGGFRGYLGFDLHRQKGVVILTNSGGDWPDEFGSILLDPTYKKPPIDKSLAKNPNYLNKFVGTYQATVFVTPDQPDQSLNIGVYGTRLYTELTCGEIGMLYPEKFGVFGIQGFPDGQVHFSFDENGDVSKVQALLLSSETILWEATPKA